MSKSTLLTLGAVLITLLAIAGMVQYARSNNGTTAPQFVFDNSRLDTSWWSSGNSNQQLVAGSDYSGEEPKNKLPVADISVHHVKADKTAKSDGCFVLFSYYNYPLDSVDEAYRNYEAKKTDLNSESKLKKVGSDQQAIATDWGDVDFDLQQYDLSVPGSDILSGYAVGFANTSSGHIRVETVCKTAADLDAASQVYSAVRLNKP